MAAKKKAGAAQAVAASPARAPSVVPSSAAAVVVGRLVVGSTPIVPLVDFAGNLAGPLRARATVRLDRPTVERAIVTAQGATLVFENGDPRLPIVTGLLQSDQSPTPFQDLLVSRRPPFEARLDGERIVLEGKQEIVLKCGEASITLRRDGKMVLRGAYVETYAKGINRIKGGSVKIN